MTKIFYAILSFITICEAFFPINTAKLISKNTTLKNIEKVSQFTEQLVATNNQQLSFDITNFSWEAEGSHNNWSYYNGIMMFALLKTGKYKYFVSKYYDDMIKNDGKINDAINKQNVSYLLDVDAVPPVRTLLYLSDSEKFYKYKKNIEDIRRRLEKHPILPLCGNNLKHQALNPWWQEFPLALDGLYMALPFLVEYEYYSNQLNLPHKNQKIYKSVFERMNWVAHNMHNNAGLYYHVIAEDGKTVNGISWLRAVGWYAMAQIDIIEKMPDTKYKTKMIQQLKTFFDAMLEVQDKHGMWRNVLYYKNENFHYLGLFNKSCNKYETSGSLMMAYALMKAYSKGYVTDKKYAMAGVLAFNGTIRKYLHRGLDGKYILSNIYRSTGASTDIHYYTDCNGYLRNEAKGIAPLILASQEAEKLMNILNNEDM